MFRPFDDIMDWIDDIGRENLPAQIHINGEIEVISLTANPYDADNVQLLIQDFSNNEIKLNVIVNRSKFLNKFFFEFMRFFRHDFDPNHWSSRGDLKQSVLNRQWYFDDL